MSSGLSKQIFCLLNEFIQKNRSIPCRWDASDRFLFRTLQNLSAADLLEYLPFEEEEGFSEGFRTAVFKGICYTFSKKQAFVMEELYKARGRPLHKHELLSKYSSQNNLIQLFVTKNATTQKKHPHPAWGSLIQHDAKGYYWLTCF
jgi:hypothetical protein